MKVTVVVDNVSAMGSIKPFRAEHGLSILLEAAGRKILLDAGQSDAAVNNLGLLGVHPTQLDAIVLSHGHYDHTGGLSAVLMHAGKEIPVYCHGNLFADRYAEGQGKKGFVGVPYRREWLESLGARFCFLTEPEELLPGLTVSGPIPRSTNFEIGDPKLVTLSSECCGQYVQDEIPDDMVIYYAGEKGLLVISGCAHSGIINVIRHGFAVTGASKLYGTIGGTHLGPVSLSQREATVAELKRLEPVLMAANHCTGFAMLAELEAVFGPRFVSASIGTVIEY